MQDKHLLGYFQSFYAAENEKKTHTAENFPPWNLKEECLLRYTFLNRVPPSRRHQMGHIGISRFARLCTGTEFATW